ncbi:hypothetical protein EUGRSUZ_D01937 [Eucalyptus grandis]|uniref:Uncharacterized protein n=2 Tax=Eucalyptus grandis TaxID=71139 RepID=A0ACC3L6K7_EUCGR|nr:hypothetical protein EUGRSUZ_D01937 [Eucalyptus grandis]
MPTPAAPPPEATEEECLHKTKLIKFFHERARIILQDKNGPCSLLAICNYLILQGIRELDQNRDEFSLEELLNLVGNALIDSNSNIEVMASSILFFFPLWKCCRMRVLALMNIMDRKSRTHLDRCCVLRLAFIIKDFVNTPELGIFHLLDIPLYHGCVVDPQDATAIGAIGSKSYDDLSSAVVAPDLTPRKRKLFQKIVENKSGLTPYGLSCLRRDVRDGELCVLFHNEHFSTMFKYKGQLYLLATDEAFLDMPNHVWEKLEKVKGGNVYVSSDFKECKMDHVGSMNDATLAVSTNDDIDEQLARSLQEEEFNA